MSLRLQSTANSAMGYQPSTLTLILTPLGALAALGALVWCALAYAKLRRARFQALCEGLGLRCGAPATFPSWQWGERANCKVGLTQQWRTRYQRASTTVAVFWPRPVAPSVTLQLGTWLLPSNAKTWFGFRRVLGASEAAEQAFDGATQAALQAFPREVEAVGLDGPQFWLRWRGVERDIALVGAAFDIGIACLTALDRQHAGASSAVPLP